MPLSFQDWSCFEDWWHHQNTYQVMFTPSPLGERSTSSPYGSSLSDELCQLAFKQNLPTEDHCIDPVLLEREPEQPVGEDRPFCPVLLDHAVGENPESMMNIDEESLGTTADIPVVTETNEQFFGRPEVRELVNMEDIPVGPETSPPTQTDAQESILVPTHPVLSPAPSSPLSSAPPTPLMPLSVEAGVELWLVDRIIQAWGPRDGRQYLIRWAGWGPEFDTWEPALHVPQELRADFERSRLRRRLSSRRKRRERIEWG